MENSIQTSLPKTNTAGSRLVKFMRDYSASAAAVIGALILLAVIIMALFAPLISPYDPNAIDVANRLAPPFSEGHFLGTDALGRDLFSRIVYGARVSLLIGVAAVLVGGTIGVVLGLISGYCGGKWDVIIMRLAEAQMAIPFLILALAIIAILGNGLMNVILVMGITSWMQYAKTVRIEVLALKNQEYIQMAKAIGVKPLKIVFSHVLPNVSSSIIVIASLQVARMILFEASLSFLGLGVPPSIPTWGSIVSDGKSYLTNAWWVSALPGIMIFITVLGINLIGNRVRDLLDPKLNTET